MTTYTIKPNKNVKHQLVLHEYDVRMERICTSVLKDAIDNLSRVVRNLKVLI